MKKSDSKENKKIANIVKLYEQYKNDKKLREFVPKKKLPPLTLDEQLENINPYYVRNETLKYG